MPNDAPTSRRETLPSGEVTGTLRPGETFAERYRLEDRVGSGGMGELFRAFDTRLQRRVALKVLRRDRNEGSDSGQSAPTTGKTVSEASARILREARAAAALNHPNVVAIHDVGERDGVPFIAMEYVKGKSLRAFVGSPTPSFETRLEWVIDVARALGAAHDRGLVHRDIKPDNVMIRDDGVVKVLDFGIARYHKAIPDSAAELRTYPTMNESGERGTNDVPGPRVLGTPGYMAPEQIRGEACDGRADQFSWGVMAYELFTGKLPWSTDRGTFYVLTSVLADEVRPLANVPFQISQTILRALEKKPQDRFDSMAELIAACGVRTPSRVDAPGATDVTALLQANTGEAQMVDPHLVQQVQRDVPSTAPKVKTVPSVVPFSRALAVGAVLGVAAASIFMVRSFSQREGAPAPTAASSVAAHPPSAPTATLVTELEASPTCSRAAVGRYHEGLTAMREATWELAMRSFEKAVEEDPKCPEAQLQLLLTGYFRYSITREREQFRHANALRDEMNERNRVFLDALAPLVSWEPADREEAARRADAATARFPSDAQMLTVMAMVKSFAAHEVSTIEQARELGRRATELDPKDADAWQTQAVALVRLGKLDEGMAALDKCLEVAPGSGDCLEDRIRILRLRGQCAAASAAARRWIANVPTSSGAYRHLANALASEGAPVESVEAALEQYRNNVSEEARKTSYMYHRLRLAALAGDFVNAEKMEERLSAEWKDSANVYDHVRTATLRMDLMAEEGKPARAAAIAEQFFRRRDAWTEGFWSTTMYEPYLLATLLQQGTIPEERWRTLTEKWEKDAAPTVSKTWGLRWGPVSMTRKQAAEIWKTRPTGELAAGSLEQPMSLRAISDSFEGRVAMMAGEYKQAIALLEPATKSCDSLEEPFTTTRAHLWLGQAKEEAGDTPGACAAYGEVLRRWADAKPRSITAEVAKRRRLALGCK
ncbi:protein kinase [Pendulispora brunnea]|uniref:Protein kinase n=1 Tax=Pendulispora brunnea TaxID=2905690 RepID=A0ABZ2K8K5_9BACT